MHDISRASAVVLLLVLITGAGCWPKSKQHEQSEIDAISAASKRLFGNNVRGYMWALTTDSPAVFAQAPSSLGMPGQATAFDPFAVDSAQGNVGRLQPPQVADASGVAPVVNFPGNRVAPVLKLDPLKSSLFQCWYYAETPVYTRLEGDELRKLFLNKVRTKKINNNFVDIRSLGEELEKSEAFRQFESFALSVLPGTCFLFSGVGPLKGSAKGAVANALCSISLASLGNARKISDGGWGSDKARLQIQSQLKSRVDELEEVNWEVLSTLKNKLAEFNSAKKFEKTTQVQCPSNETWVADLMGPH